MEDVRAVMDAVGSERAALLGTSEGGNMSVLFAATYPDRVAALVLYGCFAKGVWAPDYPWTKTRKALNEELEEVFQAWGGPFDLKSGAPSLADDPRAREWSSAYLRNAADRKTAIGIWDWNAEIDVRDVLPAVRVPTLVLHRSDDSWQPVEEGVFRARVPEAAVDRIDQLFVDGVQQHQARYPNIDPEARRSNLRQGTVGALSLLGD